jgi:ABC-type transporter MlaC component
MAALISDGTKAICDFGKTTSNTQQVSMLEVFSETANRSMQHQYSPYSNERNQYSQPVTLPDKDRASKRSMLHRTTAK